jgi:acyl-CoA dehydrogenase
MSWCASSRSRARCGLLAPQVGEEWGGQGLCHREIATVLRASGYSMLGPIAMNCMAPDEGNMHLLERVATPAQKERFLRPLAAGEVRSAFLMTEPDGGAGSDPSMLRTTARQDGREWVISGRKWLITGARGAAFGIIMARTEQAATMFLADMTRRASSSSACSTRSTSRCRAGTRSSRSTRSA